MDNTEKKNIEKFLSNTELFYSLVKNYAKDGGDSQQLLKLLRTQHTLNQSSLEDLGFVFDDTLKIRHLNQRVHQLEREQGQHSLLNFKEINKYIQYKSNSLREGLEALGIYSGVEMTVSSFFNIKIKLYTVNRKRFGLSVFDKNDKDVEEKNKKHELFLENRQKNFDTTWLIPKFSGHEENILLYTTKNIKTLENFFNDFLSAENEKVPNLGLELNFHEKFEEIRTVSIDVYTLDSHKNLQESFNER
jgi:hypothetical protein